MNENEPLPSIYREVGAKNGRNFGLVRNPPNTNPGKSKQNDPSLPMSPQAARVRPDAGVGRVRWLL